MKIKKGVMPRINIRKEILNQKNVFNNPNPQVFDRAQKSKGL